jgi:hypothetical protein
VAPSAKKITPRMQKSANDDRFNGAGS